MKAVQGSWADLSPDLLHLLVKKLPEISDFIHFRAVCKPWRATISLSDLPQQFPWILKLGTGPDLEFYSIASNKVYTVRALNSTDKDLFGPAEGYMLACHFDNWDHFSVLNPLNNSEVCLPTLDGSHIDVSWIGPQNVQSDEYVLITVLSIDGKCRLAICKAGDDKWDCIEGVGPKRYFYLKSLLFIVDHKTGVTKVMDIGSRKEAYVIPPPECEKMPNFRHFYYPDLVESCGEILRVAYCQSYEGPDYKFQICRLEFGHGKGHPRWVKVRSIGDRMLFFDFNADRGFCLRANDFAGFKGNCIYFIKKVNLGCTVINRYDIEDGRTVLVDCPFDFKDEITWFVPTLNHI